MNENITGAHNFYKNESCEFFPCHEVEDNSSFNCMFCYCPLYTLGDKCRGNFTLLDNGIKDCSNCTLPHGREGYEHIKAMYPEIVKVMRDNLEK